MLKEEAFINGIWDKYDSYNKSNNKDKFFNQHLYKNTDYMLTLRTFSTFLVVILLTVGMVYAGIATYNFIQTTTNTDFKKNSDYDYNQDMTCQNGIYYKKITNYDDYIICKNRWDDIVDMSQEDFNENFIIIIAGENYSTINLNIYEITADDNTTYIKLKKVESDTINTVVSAKISNDLYRENISIENTPEIPNVSEHQNIEDLPQDYSKEQAIKDGCFVIENNKLISNNQELMDKFVEDSQNGIDTSIRLVIYFDLNVGLNLTITDLEYKDGKYIVCEDNTRGDTGKTYYFTGSSIKKSKNTKPISYLIENDIGNRHPICIYN